MKNMAARLTAPLRARVVAELPERTPIMAPDHGMAQRGRRNEVCAPGSELSGLAVTVAWTG
jgi:hypothetical protein